MEQTSWYDSFYAQHYCRRLKIYNALYKDKGGYFSKGYYGAIDSCVKTKTKNAYASHRHKGGYGKAIYYSRHDLSQIQLMNLDLKEYYNNGEGEKSYDYTT